MKPRRLVSATTFSISWSRWTVKGGLGALQDGEYVAERILEPCNVRAATRRSAPGNASFIRQLAVVLELDAFGHQVIHGALDVIDWKVEDRVCGRNVVGLGVNEHAVSAGDLQPQALLVLLYIKPKGLAVKLLRRGQVGDRKTAERFGFVE